MNSNVNTIQAGYAAFARQDIPAVLAILDPDIVWDSPASVPTGGVFHGHDGVLGFFKGLGDGYAELHVEPADWLDAGDRVVALGRVTGIGAATGTTVDVPFAHIWTVRDGRAVAFLEFLDTATLAAALG
jgi:ketosteroid isomerase-like protein